VNHENVSIHPRLPPPLTPFLFFLFIYFFNSKFVAQLIFSLPVLLCCDCTGQTPAGMITQSIGAEAISSTALIMRDIRMFVTSLI
jgi:hypothetical protein